MTIAHSVRYLSQTEARDLISRLGLPLIGTDGPDKLYGFPGEAEGILVIGRSGKGRLVTFREVP